MKRKNDGDEEWGECERVTRPFYLSVPVRLPAIVTAVKRVVRWLRAFGGEWSDRVTASPVG